MAFDLTFPQRWYKRLIVPALLLIGVAGCQKSAQVGHYQVPKEESAASTAPDESSAGPDRMVAAIVPHAGAAWFFKLAGPADAVGKYADAFDALVKSVTFPDSADAKPQWTLPASWKQTSGGADLRFATLTISEKPPLEVTVTTLPWSPEHDLDLLLSNLNRWRGQMTLKPLDAVDLADQIHSIKLAAADAFLVDFRGTQKAGGMQPPFAAANASEAGDKSSLPAGHPQVAEQKTEIAQADQNSGAAKADQSQIPFAFAAPNSWTASKLLPFAVAAFTAQKDSGEVQITISPLAGAGGMLSNVNRWRAQLKLSEVSEDEVNSLVKPYQVDGQAAQMVQLVGPEAASPRQAITVVMFDRGDATWFLRMRGNADLVNAEQPNFEKFVGSIKFREEK